MKSPFLCLAASAALFISDAAAQDLAKPKAVSPLSKGSVTLGAGIGMAGIGTDHNSNNAGRSYNLNFTPSGGYFFSDYWLISADLHGGLNKSNYVKSRSGGIGLSARYYFGQALNAKGDIVRLRCFAEGGAAYSRSYSELSPSDTLREAFIGESVSLRAAAGVTYLLSENVAIESGLSYTRGFWNADGERAEAGSASVVLGLRIFMRRGTGSPAFRSAAIDGISGERPASVSPIRKRRVTAGMSIGVANLAYGRDAGNNSGLQHDLSIRPVVGIFLSDHWLVSGELALSASGNTAQASDISQGAGLGLSGRYYFGRAVNSKGAVNRLRFFAESGGRYQRFWQTSNFSSTILGRKHFSGIVVRAGAGVNYLLNERLALESGLHASRVIIVNNGNREHSSWLAMELGLRVFLGK